MKKTLVLLLIGATILMCYSCKKSKISNIWKPAEVYVNDTLQTLFPLGNHTLELTKDGIAIFTSLGDTSLNPMNGTWTFGDDKKTMEIYYPSATPDPDNVPAIYTIVKLKNKEMWLSREHDDGISIDIVETHYIPVE